MQDTKRTRRILASAALLGEGRIAAVMPLRVADSIITPGAPHMTKAHLSARIRIQPMQVTVNRLDSVAFENA